jgi:hypothetical protein
VFFFFFFSVHFTLMFFKYATSTKKEFKPLAIVVYLGNVN